MSSDKLRESLTIAKFGPDVELLRVGLTDWVRQFFQSDATLRSLSVPEDGQSSVTVMFDLEHEGRLEQLVARLPPPPSEDFPQFPKYDLSLQQRCMQLVGRNTKAPVPKVIAFESSPKWLGTPFVVMTRMPGIPFSTNPPYVFGGWTFDATAEQRAVVQRNCVAALGEIHRVTASAHDLSFLARPEHGHSPLEQQLGYQRWYYDWVRRGTTYPLIERAFTWLEANRPPESEAVLTWGDARPGNMLFVGTEVSAVLDWEVAGVGPCEVDIAWMAFLHSFFQEMAVHAGKPGIPGFFSVHEVAKTYEAFTGHKPQDLEWFEVFAAVRLSSMIIITVLRLVAFGKMPMPVDPDDVIPFRSQLERMIA